MMRCDDCQTLLLDHLYGLLDAAETGPVEAHLAGCPDCTAARSQAARAQGLFAHAAKSAFPQVRFAAPLDEVTVPKPRGEKPRVASKRSWLGWAVAASALALIPGTLIPLSKFSDRYGSALRDADGASARLAEARHAYQLGKEDRTGQARLDAAKEKHNRVAAEWVRAEKVELQRKVTIGVKKPLSAQPGAPNEFVLAVADPTGSLRDRRVEAQFRNQSGAVLFSQTIDPKKEAAVRLPAEVWSRVAPNSDLYLSVSAVDAAGARTELQDPIRLFGPVFATMLVTDKASYRPGDRLYFRSLTLDRITFRPPTREQKLQYALRKQNSSADPIAVLTGSTRIVKEAGGAVETVTDSAGKPILGVGCGAFVLPATLTDGDYVLTLIELAGPNGTPPAMAFPVTRIIAVRSGAPERFAKKIAFEGTSFTPGQAVIAYAELKLGDRPIVGAKGTVVFTSEDDAPVVVRVEPQAKNPDGTLIPLTGITDKNGRFRLVFPLPLKLPRGDVKLMVTFSHDGLEESVAERVPIAGKEIIVEFFPEGGKLVAGVPNRVYVRGTTSTGKPVDIRGTIAVDVRGAVAEIVAKVESMVEEHPGVNRGLGSFTFTPKADIAYLLRLQTLNPAGIAPSFQLPKAEADGVVLTALDTVTKPGQPIRLRVHSAGKDRNLVVGAYTRGQLADTQKVHVKADKPAIVTLLANADSRGGVTRITVFEEPAEKTADLIHVAERLVFRKPGELLNLTASAGVPGATFAPGSAVDLTVVATDEKGNPVPAILWAAAVNATVAPGSKDRSLPTHFLLAGEVQTPDDLEFADFLLTDHPKAAETLDLVLATQGWRRFVEQQRVPAASGSEAAQLASLNGQRVPLPKPGISRDRGALFERFWPRFEESASELEAAQKNKEAAEPAVRKLFAEYEESRRKTADLTTAVRGAAEPFEKLRDRLPYAVGSVAAFAIVMGLLALVRGAGLLVAAPYLIGTFGAGGLTGYVTYDASEHPINIPADPDEVGAWIAQVHGVAPKINLAPVPPDPIEVVPSEGPIAEEYWIFGLKMTIPPRQIPLAKPNTTKSIPADLIDHSLPRTIARAPVPAGVLSSLQAADTAARAKAQTQADERAMSLFQKVEAALANQAEAAGGSADRIRSAVPRTPPLVVREYAAPRPGSSDPTAHDADTVLWQPVIVLPTDGKTTLRFHLGNAPGYQVIVAGHTPDGRLGSVRMVLPVSPAR